MPDTAYVELNPPSLEGKVSEAEWETRVNLAAAFRVAYHFGWNNTILNHFSARVEGEPEHFVMNPQGLGWHEITASSLIKSDYQGNDLSESDYRLAPAGRNFHSAILDARRDLACVMHVHPTAGIVISATEEGLLPIDQTSSMLWGKVAYHEFEGLAQEAEEGPRIIADLGDNMMMIMRNHGLLTVGRTIAEGFALLHRLVSCCETQAQLMATGSKFTLVPEDVCKVTQAQMYERYQGRPGGDLEWQMYRRLAEKLDPGYRS
ncbi:MAG: class II aldolase/adducin family protein [Rhodospirillales bacterium]|nr:class II aldolase/adducin family protein [Rhodospirillales bacterium]